MNTMTMYSNAIRPIGAVSTYMYVLTVLQRHHQFCLQCAVELAPTCNLGQSHNKATRTSTSVNWEPRFVVSWPLPPLNHNYPWSTLLGFNQPHDQISSLAFLITCPRNSPTTTTNLLQSVKRCIQLCPWKTEPSDIQLVFSLQTRSLP